MHILMAIGNKVLKRISGAKRKRKKQKIQGDELYGACNMHGKIKN